MIFFCDYCAFLATVFDLHGIEMIDAPLAHIFIIAIITNNFRWA